MNSIRPNRGGGAFTLVELLVVIAIIGVLAAILLPALSQGKQKAWQIQCVSRLENIGVAFHVFAHDHGSRFPMEVSVQNGGSLEYVQAGYHTGTRFFFSYRHFEPLARELVTPKILICPADTRLPAKNFAALNNENLSYFVGVTAEYSKPESVLAGDRNITDDNLRGGTIQRSGSGLPLRWTAELHRFKGNLLFSDGHVEEHNSDHLALAGGQLAQNQAFVLPTVQSDTHSGAPPIVGNVAPPPIETGIQPSTSEPTTNGQESPERESDKPRQNDVSTGSSSRLTVVRESAPAVSTRENSSASGLALNSAPTQIITTSTSNSEPVAIPPSSRFEQVVSTLFDRRMLPWLVILLLIIATLVALRLRQIYRRAAKENFPDPE